MTLKSLTTKIRRTAQFFSASPAVLYQRGKGLLGFAIAPELYYVTPQSEWITDWIGHYLTTEVKRQFRWRAHQISIPSLLTGQIIHYGELGTFSHFLDSPLNNRNTILVTVFHGDRSPLFPELTLAIDTLLANDQLPRKIVTACQIMQQRLLSWGIAEQKIACIPLGVDLELFQPCSPEEKLAKRHRYHIPNDAVCIGSFQKDGIGWQKGTEPKKNKGPDIFLQVIEKLHRQYPIFVLLSGPARGYVIRGLQELKVPYRHIFLANFRDIPHLYHCLDLYLVTSREEGGPSAVLESLACGIPIVSTRVGLAPDIIQHGRNGLLTDIEKVDDLVEQCERIILDENLRQSFSVNGLKDIQPYDWSLIASRYYKEIYLPLLQSL